MADMDRRGFLGGVISATVAPAAAQVSASGAMVSEIEYEFSDGAICSIEWDVPVEQLQTLKEWFGPIKWRSMFPSEM